MSKRLKYAKLRLAKPSGETDVPVEMPKEQESSGQINDGEIFLRSCKQSKFFTNDCSSQNTFIEIEDDQSPVKSGETIIQSSRRRTQEEAGELSIDGPKLPKLRKKTSKGNVLISNFLSNHTPEDDDFEESRPISVAQPKPTKVQRTSRKPKPPRKPKNQSDIRKIFKKYKSDYAVLQELIKDHSASDQIDPEQLQIALAMSRSLIDRECSASAKSSADVHTNPASCSMSSEERRIVGIRTSLEQFGFKCKNSYTDYDLNVIFGGGCKNVKKIKHKRATNLMCRTKEELFDFIDRRTKKLFSLEMITLDSAQSAQLAIENEQSYLSQLFWIAQTEQASKHLVDKYYVPELLENDPAPVGCLLKDWSKIPGRETTPEKDEHAISTSLETSERTRMTSPDLFGEGEDLVSNRNPNICDISIGRTGQIETEQTIGYEGKKAFPSDDQGSSLLRDATVEGAAITIQNFDKDHERYSETAEGKLIALNGPEKAENNESVEIQKVITIDSESSEEEEHFFTAKDIPSARVPPTFHCSADNIFDETDPDPIVSFEVYSSEEEKISAASQAFREESSIKDNSNPTIEVAIDSSHRSHLSKTPVQPVDECSDHVLRSAEPYSPAKTNDNCGLSAMQPLMDEKELSFNRIAVKARLSEALKKSAFMVETVDLVDVSDGVTETNEVEYSDPLQRSLHTEMHDACLYISDDEVHYSVHEELSRSYPTEEVEPRLEVDVDKTLPYFSQEPPVRFQEDECNASKESQVCIENEILSVSSCENRIEDDDVELPVNCAESTFAYLDSLVKQFSLPSLKPPPQAATKNCTSPGQLEGTQRPNLSPIKFGDTVYQALSTHCELEYINNLQNVCESIQDHSPHIKISFESRTAALQTLNTANKNNTSFQADELTNFLDNYEVPEFDENAINAEMIASQGSPTDRSQPLSQVSFGKVCGRVKSCTQPLESVSSKAGATCCSTAKEVHSAKLERFVNKFYDLKATAMVSSPEYLITTENVNIRPPHYEDMSTPEIERELYKHGLKALKRSKAIKVLYPLFEKTHPVVEVKESMEQKIRNEDGLLSSGNCSSLKLDTVLPACASVIPQISDENMLRTRQCAFKLNIDADEIYLPSKPRKKIAWSAVPLHIAFFNLVSENEALQRQILLYTPVNLDHIHSTLKDVGLRYERKDLIAFLDKKCVTFRCASSSGDRTKSKANDCQQ